jgi:hypothetical protein
MTHDTYEEELFNIPGKRCKSRREAMTLAERTMHISGWLDPSPDGLPDVGSLIPMVPEFDQSGKLWRAAVLAKKQEILQEKTKHMPTGSGAKPNAYDFKSNVIVDREYIDRFFNGMKPVDGDIIRCVLTEYSLNDEQERAFRIIANHATLKNPENLCMYL